MGGGRGETLNPQQKEFQTTHIKSECKCVGLYVCVHTFQKGLPTLKDKVSFISRQVDSHRCQVRLRR